MLSLIAALLCLPNFQMLHPGYDYAPVDTLDVKKASQAGYPWVMVALLPSQKTINEKRYSGSIDAEKSDLLKAMSTRFRKDALPSREDIDRDTIGLAEMDGRSDYLLLHYRTRSNYDVTVLDGRYTLNVVVVVPEAKRKPLSEVGELVWETTSTLLEYPVAGDVGASKLQIRYDTGTQKDLDYFFQKVSPDVPRVFIYPKDIGASKAGYLSCGPWSPDPAANRW